MAGYMGDLFRFTAVGTAWTNLTGAVSGPSPPPRAGHGLASTSGWELFVFGGVGEKGEALVCRDP